MKTTNIACLITIITLLPYLEQVVQEKSAIEQAKHSSDRFNQAIIEENQYAYYLNRLVSPISAKGIYLNKKCASRF
ncbi:hypothetical protein AOD79_0206435 [Helicobacter pylori]|nr:hypothetical protein AOD79_0206435 [Helicobacter pylori]